MSKQSINYRIILKISSEIHSSTSILSCIDPWKPRFGALELFDIAACQPSRSNKKSNFCIREIAAFLKSLVELLDVRVIIDIDRDIHVRRPPSRPEEFIDVLCPKQSVLHPLFHACPDPVEPKMSKRYHGLDYLLSLLLSQFIEYLLSLASLQEQPKQREVLQPVLDTLTNVLSPIGVGLGLGVFFEPAEVFTVRWRENSPWPIFGRKLQTTTIIFRVLWPLYSREQFTISRVRFVRHA